MKQIQWILAVLFLSTVTFTSCKKDEDPQPTPNPNQEAYDNADFKNGGIMYDKFWASESNFDQNNSNLGTLGDYGDFFRCKQCHGWDGLGSAGAYISRGPKTSRPNVSGLNLYQLAQTKTADELFQAMKATNGRRDISTDLSTYDPEANNTEGDKMPNYTQLLTDAQIWDLVKFMKEGMYDVSQLYDGIYTGTYPTGSFAFENVGKDGNEANGNALYSEKCASCHGADGATLDLGGRTVGQFTREKSYEVQHKVKYGQLGSGMTGEFDMTLTEMKDLYKAMANPTNFPDANQISYNNADFKNGGIMYDKFWASESNFDQNDPNLATISDNADFFRCKQCHGWDGLGSAGAYINRAPKTTRPNVSALNLYQLAQTKTADELFEAMKATNGRRDISYDLPTYDPETNNTEGDKMPNYSQILTDAQIWDIIKYMKESMFDVTNLYDINIEGTYPTGSRTFSNVGKDGNEANGNALYSEKCASCHGADGTSLDLGGRSAGQFTREKSYEVQHKVKYGQLGSGMTGEFDMTLTEMKDLYKAMANSTNFPDL